jgi:hypothetical protein
MTSVQAVIINGAKTVLSGHRSQRPTGRAEIFLPGDSGSDNENLPSRLTAAEQGRFIIGDIEMHLSDDDSDEVIKRAIPSAYQF